MQSITVDFNKEIGKIKPMNGVNAGPKTKVFTYDATELFKEAHIPYSRLHDVEYPYGSGEFVDIHCIFPNFDADVNNPASYRFALTDCYIRAILDAGTKVIYRLGESIEHAPVNRYIYPPKDNQKWAEICEHIIRHYNEGWADGHYWNIEYWEIWFEADHDTHSEVDPHAHRSTWAGSLEEFYDFYETASKHLKSCFPHLKIGGPALASRIPWAADFTAEMAKRNVPMDFFSWHIYTSKIEKALERGNALQEILTKNGYTDTELIMDEWNYVESWNRQPRSFRKLTDATGAAFGGALMIATQHSTNALATYFEADVVKEWCGIFKVKDMAIGQRSEDRDPCVLEPRKPFYAFKAFGKLLSLGTEVASFSETETTYVCAAKNEVEKAVMLVSYHSGMLDKVTEIALTGLPKCGCKIEVYLTDEGNTEKLEKTVICNEENFLLTLRMSDEQVRLIRITPQ